MLKSSLLLGLTRLCGGAFVYTLVKVRVLEKVLLT
jgi:hypothetical protein